MEQKLQAAIAAAGASTPPPPAAAEESKRAVPPVAESYQELMTHSVKELKGMLAERGVSHADCLEKSDLATRIVERCSMVTHYV